MLAGIVAGVGLLILAVVILTLAQPPAEYKSEETPVGIAYNYLLALQNEDYGRAYGYLSPTLKCYPLSVSEFKRELQTQSYSMRNIATKAWAVEEQMSTGFRVTVVVAEVSSGGGGFLDSGQAFDEYEVVLSRSDDTWTVVDADRYFVAWRWTSSTCK
jgi:hypothetical protein